MTNETRKRIRAYKKALPELRERVIAVALLLAMSVSMLGSASFAWITLSAAPEATGMQTTVAANGNLEIALAQGSTSSAAVAPGESQVGDSSAAEGQSIVSANVTWGNLVNVSDPTYGLSQIALRPALLSAYNRTEYPLNGATYGGDGRVVSTNDRYSYSSYALVEGTDNQYFFDAANVNYGVRAISSVGYENFVGDNRVQNFIVDTTELYNQAQEYYGKIVSNETNEVNTLDSASGVTCISALEGLVTIFAQDKINAMGYGYGKNEDGSVNYTSCSPYIWYLKEMLLRLQTALDKEGKAILEMANWQAYMNYEENPDDKTFASIDDVIAASNTKTTDDGTTKTVLESKGVNIATLESYKTSLESINYCLYGQGTDDDPGLLYMASKCENPDAPEVDYYWQDIADYVDVLVDIETATMAGKKLSDIQGISDALDIVGGGDVIIYDGELYNIEKRFVDDTHRVQADVIITVYINYMFINYMDIEGTVYTDAYGETPDYSIDMANSESLDSSNKGAATAKDTYGLAIDLWVRTNYPDAVLTLEGSAVYEDQRATATIEGTVYELYTMTVTDGDIETTVDVYKKTENETETWYYLSTNTEVPTDEQGTFAEKFIAVIVGYEGENRVWEDWRELLEGGYIEQDATTQGAGSCFVFYADTPTEQVKIMEMLEAFNVAFMDQSGTILGTAQLNLDNAYANQGKVTVPLEVVTGTDYTDESGKTYKGITTLTQNTPTMITAIVYLNGSKLQNENVLAEGELQGQLNIQFGTDSTLVAPDNEELQAQARTITASVTANGTTVTNATIGGENGLDYKAEGYETTVTLTVDGDQPERISGFFVRVINSTQGTRCDELTFTKNEDGTWTATTTLTNPGLYAFNTLIVDGVQYTLHDGSEQSGMNTYYEANRPYVRIGGLKITSASVGVNAGTYMTADSSMTFPVTVKVDSAVEPKQVSAQFFSEDNTKQYTAILTYDSINEQWTGSANISSSDTYTLKYISVDGQILDAPSSGSYTLYLGLTARVSTTVASADRTYVFNEEDTDGVQLGMIVNIYDDSHQMIPNLTGVLLYYNNVLSPAEMKWTGSQYVGELDATQAGIMTFQKLVIGSAGTVYNVENAPVFTALNIKPPSFVSGKVNFTKKTVIGNATPAVVTVTLSNGQTATAWAKMVNATTGAVEYVKGVHNATSQNNVTFDVPMADGVWTVTEIYLQNCYDSDANWYEDTGTTPTANDSIVFTMTDEQKAAMTVDIVATYSTAVYYDTDGDGFEESELLTSSQTFNLTGTADAPTGTLLNGYAPNEIGVVILDYAGRSVDGVTAEDSKWVISYDDDTDTTYGSYDGASVADINADFILQEDVTIGENTYDMLVSEEVTLYHSGVYTATIQVKPGMATDSLSIQPQFTIATKKPTVTVTGVGSSQGLNETIGTVYRVYTVSEPTSASQLVGGDSGMAFSSFTTNSAVVYIQTPAKTGDNDQEAAEACTPTVTLTLSGVPANATATMIFETENEQSQNSTFNFANGTATASVGKAITGTRGIAGVWDYPECYPAGEMTQDRIVITYEGRDYTVILDEDEVITINQPQYPPYVDFVDISTIDSSFSGTTPSRIYSTDGETVTLPVTQTWQETKKSADTSGLVEDVSSLTPTSTSTIYYAKYYGRSGRINQHTVWDTWSATKKVYEATTSADSWTVTNNITGWTDGTNNYSLNQTIEITGHMTLRPIISETDNMDHNPVTTNMIRTVISGITSTGQKTSSWSSDPPSNHTEVSATPTSSDTGWVIKE